MRIKLKWHSILLIGLALLLASSVVGCKNPRYIYANGAVEVGGNGEPIVLINNPNATNPTYAELMAFIINDNTNTLPYIEGGPEAYVCSDFAEKLHNNAEAAGIKAAWVGIDFIYESLGHALNVFETTDKGLFFIDCTGELEKTWVGSYYLPEIHPVTFEIWTYEENIPDSIKLTKWDIVAYIEIGKEYGSIGITQAKSFDYEFYLDYTQAWQDYEIMLEEYNAEVELYNKEILGKIYIEGSQKLERIEAWEAELQEQEQILISLEEELGYYYYCPLGIVEDINIHW